MKKKKLWIKMLSVLSVMNLHLFFLPNKSQASIWTDIYYQATNFLTNGKYSSDYLAGNGLGGSISGIFTVLLGIGTVLTVVVGGILGIQFMMASAEDKAKIKESLIPYILGCIIIFGAIVIWRIVVEVLQDIAI